MSSSVREGGPARRSLLGEGGFNLIEVVLAVAVVAVGLLAILGLLGGALNSSRSVKDNTVMALLVDDFLNWRSISPFECPTYFPDKSVIVTNLARPYAYTNYFDVNGYLSTDVAGTNLINWAAYMRFVYQVTDHPSFPGSPDIVRVVLTVDWPINPATSNTMGTAQTRYFVSDFSNHW